MYIFCNGDLDRFMLLRKDVYSYEHKNRRKKIYENTIPPKEAFYSKSNLESISNADYENVKKVWEAFKIKKILENMFNALRYCLQMYLKTLGKSLLKYMNLILLIFFLHQY